MFLSAKLENIWYMFMNILHHYVQNILSGSARFGEKLFYQKLHSLIFDFRSFIFHRFPSNLPARRGICMSPSPPSFLDFWHLRTTINLSQCCKEWVAFSHKVQLFGSLGEGNLGWLGFDFYQARWEKWESVEQAIREQPKASNSAILCWYSHWIF